MTKEEITKYIDENNLLEPENGVHFVYQFIERGNGSEVLALCSQQGFYRMSPGWLDLANITTTEDLEQKIKISKEQCVIWFSEYWLDNLPENRESTRKWLLSDFNQMHGGKYGAIEQFLPRILQQLKAWEILGQEYLTQNGYIPTGDVTGIKDYGRGLGEGDARDMIRGHLGL